jgi:hypothetical protein
VAADGHETSAGRPELSRNVVLGWIVIAVAVVVGVSILVGFVGPKPGFEWDLASIFGTALGTTLLAAGTGALAYSTWSDVRATWELAELTKRDQDERERPTVLLQSALYNGNVIAGYLRLRLRNVGLGPALRVAVTIRLSGDQHQPSIDASPKTLPVIAPNDTEELSFYIQFGEDRPNDVSAESFAVTGTFTDRSQHGHYEIIIIGSD